MHKVENVWSSHARKWSDVGVPQRPSPEDVVMFFAQAGASLRSGSTTEDCCHVGILGVTPELVQGPWPGGTIIDAFDRSLEMITSHWREPPRCQSRVHQAEWHALPVEDGRFSMIVGDGCTTQFPDRAYYASFFREMHRVLRPCGAFVARCFLRPETSKPLDAISRRAMQGLVRNFGALKWQLAMALTDPVSQGVEVRVIARVFDELFPDRDALAASTGWTRATIDTIDAYRVQAVSYTFPSLTEFENLCRPYFDIAASCHGSYELADCCPIIRLTPRTGDRPGPP